MRKRKSKVISKKQINDLNNNKKTLLDEKIKFKRKRRN